MKIPKYIMRLIERRAKLATELTQASYELDEWLARNDILDSLEEYDYGTGVEIYVKPYDSAQRIIEAIEKKDPLTKK